MAQDETRTVQIEVTKKAARNLDVDAIIGQVSELKKVVNKEGSKWVLDFASSVEGSTEWMRTRFPEGADPSKRGPRTFVVWLTLTGPRSSAEKLQIDQHLLSISKRGSQFMGEPWIINRVDGSGYEPMSDDERFAIATASTSGMVAYAEANMPKDPMAYFKDLFGVDPQIRMLLRRAERAIESDFENRFHAVLVGPPGCGKSTTLTAFQAMFGRDACIRFDGTAMTSAGVIATLNALDVMPRFILIEEIDKAPNDAVAVLLGIMDAHGELRKTTAKGNIAKDCRAMVLATANSWTRLKEMQMGAVASRFGDNPIKFKRPEDDMLRAILMFHLEKSAKTRGHKNAPKWIERTLEWCNSPEVDNHDPRYVISVCINGQDDLLTNQYYDDMRETMILKNTVLDFD